MPAEIRHVPKGKAAKNTLAPQIQLQFQQAVAFFRLGRWAEAQALCEGVLKKSPAHPDTLHLLGVIAYQTGQFPAAADLIGQAIEILPNNPDFHSNRGHVLQELKQLDAAVASYDQAIALRPDAADAYYNRGNALQKLGRCDDAIASYDRAIALSAVFPKAYYSRGNAFVRLKQLDAAIASYDKAIALKPDFLEAYNNRGNVLQDLKQLDAAIASFDRALALRPSLADTWYNRGNALQDLERFDAAIASYDRAIALRPDLADAHYNRGNALTKLGRIGEALACYAKVVTLDPEHTEVRKTLLQHHIVEGSNLPLIEQLSRELSELNLKHELATLSARQTMPDFRVLHELEQTNYLLALGYDGDGLREANARLRDVYARHAVRQISSESAHGVALSEDDIADIGRYWNNLLRYRVAADINPALNPENDWLAIEAQYFASAPEIIHIDHFLSPQALVELRKFCLISTIWRTEYCNQYLGAFAENGFIGPLQLQIARELAEKMPRVFGDHALEQLWAFKYDSRVATGINVHADFARVNLNFWITPDDANLDPASGGLVVYDVPSPPSWSFDDYNINEKRIYEFLEKSGAGKRVVPHRCNRAVLFNSSLFHETDKIHFKEGYENRRINITYLFGVGLRA